MSESLNAGWLTVEFVSKIYEIFIYALFIFCLLFFLHRPGFEQGTSLYYRLLFHR